MRMPWDDWDFGTPSCIGCEYNEGSDTDPRCYIEHNCIRIDYKAMWARIRAEINRIYAEEAHICKHCASYSSDHGETITTYAGVRNGTCIFPIYPSVWIISDQETFDFCGQDCPCFRKRES